MKKMILFLILLCPICVNAYDTSASSTALMDMDSNNIIYSNNMNKVRSVASISKIMTAIVAIESNKLDDKVIIGDEILKSYGSNVYLSVGEELTLRDLLYALMLRSGNDASFAIANYVGGSVDNFVNLMNELAKKLNMNNTTFNNPNGLEDNGGNLSTAYDMALLTSYAMKNETYREITQTKKYKLQTNKNYYLWTNKNKLLNYDYITGGKTGFTEIARRTLVTTASKNNINLVAVTLNDGNDFQDHLNLFKEAFENYTNYQILKRGNIEIIGEKYYPNGSFYIENDFYYTLNNNTNNIILNIKLDKKEYNNHDKIGNIEVIVNSKKVHDESIYILKEDVNFIKKIRKWITNLW